MRIGDYELHVWDEYERQKQWTFGERPNKDFLLKTLKHLLAERTYSACDEKVKIAWNLHRWDGIVEHGEGVWDKKKLEITCLEVYK